MNPLQLRIKQYLCNSILSRVHGLHKRQCAHSTQTAKCARSTQTANCARSTQTAKSLGKQRSYFIVSSCPAF